MFKCNSPWKPRCSALAQPIQTTEHESATKGAWISLWRTVPNENSQSQKVQEPMRPLIWHSWNNKIIKVENRLVVAGAKEGWGWGGGYKQATRRTLVLTEMLSISTVWCPRADWDTTVALQDVSTRGHLTGARGLSLHDFFCCCFLGVFWSPHDFLQLLMKLQLSQNV